MKRFSKRHSKIWMGLLTLAVFILVGFGNLTNNLVVCIESNGHVNLEFLGQECCSKSQSSISSNTLSIKSSCKDCQDIPVSLKSSGHSDALAFIHPPISQHQLFPTALPVTINPSPFLLAAAANSLLSQPPPIQNPTLVARRTIVLQV